RAILPVVDLRKRFDLPATPPNRASKYLITAIEGLSSDGDRAPAKRWIVALVVDAVKEVLRVPREEVRPAPAITLGESARFFSGVCRHRDRIVLIVDIDRILSSQERISLAGMSELPTGIGDGAPSGKGIR